MYTVILLAMTFLFLYFLRVTNLKYKAAEQTVIFIKQADEKYGAAFIRLALKEEELKNMPPNQVTYKMMRELNDQRDELISNYRYDVTSREDEGHQGIVARAFGF